jgi:hypothetical protein
VENVDIERMRSQRYVVAEARTINKRWRSAEVRLRGTGR